MKKLLILLLLVVAFSATAQTNVVEAVSNGVGLDLPGLNLLPVKIQKWILGLAVVIPLLGRIIHGASSGGGLVGIWNGIVFGSNGPKAKVVTPEPPKNV